MTSGVSSRRALLDKSATKLFLILHDSFSGRPVIRQNAIKRGIIGAELADLIMARRLGMENDRIVLADESRRGADAISGFVLESIRAQPDAYTVPVWVATMAHRLFDLLASLLVHEGIVRRERSTRLRRVADRFPPEDLLAAAGPRVRLEHDLAYATELDLPTQVVAALMGSIGAVHTIDADRGRSAVRRRIEEITRGLPLDLRDLIIGMEVAHASGELPPSLRLHTDS